MGNILLVAIVLASIPATGSASVPANPVQDEPLVAGTPDGNIVMHPPPSMIGHQDELFMVPRQDVARAQAQGFRVALKREVPDEAVLWEIDRALLEVDQRAREQAEEEKARKLVVFDEKLAASDEKLATARQELAAARQELAAAEAKAGEPGDLVWAVFLGLVRGATLDLMDIGMRLFAEASYRMTVELRATHPGAAAIGTIVGVIALVFVVFRSRLTRWSFGRAVRKSLGRDLTVEELQDLDHVVRGWERGVVWLKCGGGCRGGGG